MSLDDRPLHPAAHAYVLKLRVDCVPALGIWRGRIEHVDSGRQHDFASSDDLLAWLADDHQGLPLPAHGVGPASCKEIR